jgi:hypothetical protein
MGSRAGLPDEILPQVLSARTEQYSPPSFKTVDDPPFPAASRAALFTRPAVIAMPRPRGETFAGGQH